ncbi:MAG TPA: response regulator transcription factor [Actinocrinis sp.]|uniref:response regulator transcription factor n=1 Tax=Actinocrinis sp. TaxID=1920516 RepID=UPI002DDD6173|nr:response regulator transcription factor [Actinocrinis sp.]HEV2347560.1 response regulator transcription factor [Actinocrinis sp.]
MVPTLTADAVAVETQSTVDFPALGSGVATHTRNRGAARPAAGGAMRDAGNERNTVAEHDTVVVRIDARDPISEAGVRMQLRARSEIRVARVGEPAAVVVAVTDTVDEEATRWLRGLHRADGLPVVLVSGQVDGRALSALVEAGVRGVLRRHEATADRLVTAVRAAAAGHGDLPPELLRQLLDHLAGLNRQVLSPRGYSFTGLTERERTVLQLLADGLSTREVALRLSYSERTIKTVIQDLTLRLQLRNRTQAVAYALRNGWI